jgi:hypothetical protein
MAEAFGPIQDSTPAHKWAFLKVYGSASIKAAPSAICSRQAVRRRSKSSRSSSTGIGRDSRTRSRWPRSRLRIKDESKLFGSWSHVPEASVTPSDRTDDPRCPLGLRSAPAPLFGPISKQWIVLSKGREVSFLPLRLWQARPSIAIAVLSRGMPLIQERKCDVTGKLTAAGSCCTGSGSQSAYPSGLNVLARST